MKNEESSLVLMTGAEEMLVKATTIQKAKELKDLALTAKQWATRKGLGKKIIQHCMLYAIEAEIRIGELIIAGQEAGQIAKTGGDRKSKIIITQHDNDFKPAKLKELGITPNESAQAQKIATAPKEIIEKLRSGEIKLNTVQAIIKKREREMAREKAASKIKTVNPHIMVGDFRERAIEIPDGSISLIFTDPPYNQKALDLFPLLAEFAFNKLADGGSLLCYCGHLQLTDALNIFSEKLRFWWVIACLYSGNKNVIFEYGIHNYWKPILWFVKKTRDNPNVFVKDTISGGKEKEHHEWQQAESEAEYWIDKLCPENGIVCDPFLGSGTTAVAAKKINRKWIGIEIDPITAKEAAERIEKP